jgi:hypothetical protein
MSAALRLPLDVIPFSYPDATLRTASKSRSDVSVQKFGKTDNVLYLPTARADQFKRWFATAFARYLRERFANPEQVATAFSVRNSTAWNWWHGDNRASGDAVARLFMDFPDVAQWFQTEWARQ